MKISASLLLLFLLPIFSNAQHIAPQLSFKIPQSLKAGELYSIGVNIARNNNTGGFLFEMDFPFGYIVNEQQSDDALFSFSDSKLEYQWLILPEKDTLRIEFALLIPENAQANIVVPGNLTYTLNDVRVEQTISALQLSVQTEIPVQISKGNSPNAKEEMIIEAQTHIPKKTEVERELIGYKLQLGAFKNQVNKEAIAHQFGIPVKEIVEFKHQGMFKYAFGNFANPAEARNSIKKFPSMKDKAFVIGFKNGKRIDLDEVIEGTKEEIE